MANQLLEKNFFLVCRWLRIKENLRGVNINLHFISKIIIAIFLATRERELIIELN